MLGRPKKSVLRKINQRSQGKPSSSSSRPPAVAFRKTLMNLTNSAKSRCWSCRRWVLGSVKPGEESFSGDDAVGKAVNHPKTGGFGSLLVKEWWLKAKVRRSFLLGAVWKISALEDFSMCGVDQKAGKSQTFHTVSHTITFELCRHCFPSQTAAQAFPSRLTVPILVSRSIDAADSPTCVELPIEMHSQLGCSCSTHMRKILQPTNIPIKWDTLAQDLGRGDSFQATQLLNQIQRHVYDLWSPHTFLNILPPPHPLHLSFACGSKQGTKKQITDKTGKLDHR